MVSSVLDGLSITVAKQLTQTDLFCSQFQAIVAGCGGAASCVPKHCLLAPLSYGDGAIYIQFRFYP